MYSIEQFAKSDQLPTLPEVANRLLEVAQQENPDFKEVSQIIRSDPVVSSKILKTVNSALFAFTPKIESIEQAVPKLGVNLLRTLVLSFHLSNLKTQQDLESVFQRHWRSSLTQAVFAELIAEELGDKIEPSNCFLAAMMQDIGILAMLSEAPEEYLENVLDRSGFPNVIAGERSHFGFSHAEVSVAIVKNMGMEPSFVDAIAHHHDHVNVPSSGNGSSRTVRLKTVLQAANLGSTVLASSRNSALSLDSSLDQWVDFLNVNFGFTDSQAEDLITDVNRRVQQYSVVFNFNIGENVQTTDVVHKAKVLLQEIALKNQMNMLSRNGESNDSQSGVSNSQSGVSVSERPETDEMYLDPMTGLFNRRYMNKFLNDKIAYWVKKRKPIAFMFMDVDKFKSINDTYGHRVGDQAIIHVAQWLKESVRKGDIAIRVGGDEYIVVLQSVTKRDFETAANRVVDEIPKMKVADEEISVGLSVGCVFYQPIRGDVADVNWLIEQADQAMYRAKKGGGGSAATEMFIGTEASCASK